MLHLEFQAYLAGLLMELSQELQNGEVLHGNPGISRKIIMLLLCQGSQRLDAKSSISSRCENLIPDSLRLQSSDLSFNSPFKCGTVNQFCR